MLNCHVTIHFIQELAKKDITITKLYATSVTPTGIAILRNAKFQEIGQIGKCIAFELDTMTSDAPLAIKYRAILNKRNDSKTNEQPQWRKGQNNGI